MLLFEVKIPSLRILTESGLEEAEWAQACFDQLNLIEDKRLAAMSHKRLYQSKVKNAFDRRVSPHKFSKGDLVLKKVLQFQKDHQGKWALKYEGPFVVKKAFLERALLLMNMDNEELSLLVNSDIVKRYYA